MPNPIMLATTTPTAPPKSDVRHRDRPVSEQAPSFEEMLKHEDAADADTPDLAEVAPLDDVESDEARGVTVPTADALPDSPRDPAVATAYRSPATQLAGPDGKMPQLAASVPVDQPVNPKATGERVRPNPLPDALQQDAPQKTGPYLPDRHRAPEAAVPFGKVPLPAKIQREVKSTPPDDAPHPVNREPELRSEARLMPQSVVPSAQKPAPIGSATPVQMQLVMSAVSQETEKPVFQPDIDNPFTVREDTSPQPRQETGSAVMTSPSAARAEVTRAIAGQMAAAIHSRPGASAFEVTLSPEELGRVSIALNGRDDGFHVTISAERPETLDLMRRHISVLASEFQKLGLGDLSIDLGTSAGSQQDTAPKPDFESFDAPGAVDDTPKPVAEARMALGKRIDIRL